MNAINIIVMSIPIHYIYQFDIIFSYTLYTNMPTYLRIKDESYLSKTQSDFG